MLDYSKTQKKEFESSKIIFNFGIINLIICTIIGIYLLLNSSFTGFYVLIAGIFQVFFWSSISEIIKLLYDIKTKLEKN